MHPELRELIDACLQRGSRPIPLPHCAICARYAHENLPFEAILALLDSMPTAQTTQATAQVAQELAALPAAYRQQLVKDNTFAALLAAPSWPLIRSLVVDLYGENIERFFADPRLRQIEQITLLGGAYGGPHISLRFLTALTESPTLTAVRKFTIHSGDIDDAGWAQFWASPFAARLEEIEGVSYRGEPILQPLRATVIAGLCFWGSKGASPLGKLLDPMISPQLAEIVISGQIDSEPALAVLQATLDQVARLESVSVGFWQLTPTHFAGLQRLCWPDCVQKVQGQPKLRDNFVYLNSDMLYVAQADHNDGELVKGSDCLTGYGATLFELDATQHLSHRLKELNVIVPPERDIAEVVSLIERLEQLEELAIFYPFSQQQVLELARAPALGRLRKLQLLLSPNLGGMTSQYTVDRAAAYQSPLTPAEVCSLVSGEALRGVQNLTIAGDAIEIARSQQEFQHVRLSSSEAAQAFAKIKDARPIETLQLSGPLTAEDFAAFRQTNIFRRVHRLTLDGPFDDAAIAVFVADTDLSHLRVLIVGCYRGLSPAAFAAIVESPHLRNVRDFFYTAEAAEATQVFARSPLLPRLVSLGTHAYLGYSALAEGKQLPLLRRLDETLTSRIFVDGRQARTWLAANPSTPLRAALQAFIERTYSLDDPRTAEQIMADLESCDRKSADFDKEERRIYADTRALLANVFKGRPVPAGTPFAVLSELQQRALRVIDKVCANWWNVDNLMRDPLASYGFNFYQDRFQEFLAGKVNSE